MAMVGIVPTKLSAENGAIKPGDLLVTASTPGYAMKGTNRLRMLGAVVSKALGGLDTGRGVIEVGVALQWQYGKNVEERRVMKKIDCHRAGVAFCIVAFAISTTAQNTFPATGNVGIGTTSPVAKLDVNGSINISGAGAGIIFPNVVGHSL